MASHNELGKRGEDIAAAYLQQKGYALLARNWRGNHWEIDIIVKKEDTLVFAEVKTLSTGFFGHPEEAVDNKKERYIAAAADRYMEKHRVKGEIRFDIISITFNKEGHYELHHIEDAFY